MGKISIVSQILEVEREIRMRRQAYARRVGNKDMRQAEADLLIERMEAVRQTLIFCQDHEADIRAYMAGKKAAEGGAA